MVILPYLLFSIYIFQFIGTIIFLSLHKLCLLMFFRIVCKNRRKHAYLHKI